MANQKSNPDTGQSGQRRDHQRGVTNGLSHAGYVGDDARRRTRHRLEDHVGASLSMR